MLGNHIKHLKIYSTMTTIYSVDRDTTEKADAK